MTKVAIMGQIHEDGLAILNNSNFDVIEITDFSHNNLINRIKDVDGALNTAATSIVRSAAGKLELDELQSSRESMNQEIAQEMQDAAEVWGIEITRTEITDIIIDEQTKDAQRQQLNAERERRASIAKAEGSKRSIELEAEARLFQAQKEAEAIKVTADAEAYSVKVKAEADAEQTRVIASAIKDNGQPAINFEVMKRQVEALSEIASSNSAKTIIMPSEITGVIGSLQVMAENLKK